ncbi:acyl-CoA desaturase [Cyanobium sp. HWJ4-Hawea]|uniref:acyl-CoA desaturase n=1 Tax=Cyanobium sp. HWJ4-Hawea TaxID=2823713 RepID=UPI0020CF0F6B|nr:acyl-CoA desaturase [Cyanobium sp. HWJ4-Hawea]
MGLPLMLLYALGPVFIILSHLGCLILLFTGLDLAAALWALGLYAIRMLAITAIYHRLITHGSYQAPKAVAWLGALVAASAGQMGPSWWKGHHQQHHLHVDTAADPHSPLLPQAGWGGFWHSQVGWLLSPSFFPEQLPADVEADPVLRQIDRFHSLPLLGLAALSWQLGGWAWLGAFCLSTAVLFHGVASVNSVAHLVGGQPFATGDASRNNRWVALITFGEGWHNMHHAFQASARQGFTLRGGQLRLLPDPTYRFIRLLQWFGWASKLRIPSDRALLARALKQDPGIAQ